VAGRDKYTNYTSEFSIMVKNFMAFSHFSCLKLSRFVCHRNKILFSKTHSPFSVRGHHRGNVELVKRRNRGSALPSSGSTGKYEGGSSQAVGKNCQMFKHQILPNIISLFRIMEQHNFNISEGTAKKYSNL
jgi:hypothetical protein